MPKPRRSADVYAPRPVAAIPFTKFGSWFKKQFGYFPPSVAKHVEFRELMYSAEAKFNRAKAVYDEADLRGRIHDAAMKGWLAGYEAGRYEVSKGKKP